MVLFLSPPCLAKTPSKGRGRKIKEYKEFREFREDKDVNAKLPKLSNPPLSVPALISTTTNFLSEWMQMDANFH